MICTGLRAYDTILTDIYDFAETNMFCDLHEIFQNGAEFFREIFYLQNGGGQSSKSPRFQLTKCKQILPNIPNWEWIIGFISGWLLSCVFFCVTGQWEMGMPVN